MIRPTQTMNSGIHDDSYFSRFGLSHFSLYKTLYHFILDMSALIILSGPRCFHVTFVRFSIPYLFEQRHVSCITTVYLITCIIWVFF